MTTRISKVITSLRRYAATDPWVCVDCGSEDVQQTMWVEINTNKVIDEAYGDEYHCPQCDAMVRRPVLRSQYKG